MPVSFPGIIIYLHFSITASQMPARTLAWHAHSPREGRRGDEEEEEEGTLGNRVGW